MSYDLCPSLGSPVPTLVPYFGQKYHLRTAQTKEGLDWKKQQRICVYLQFYYLPACIIIIIIIWVRFFEICYHSVAPEIPVLTLYQQYWLVSSSETRLPLPPKLLTFFLMKRHFMVYFNFRNSKYVQGHDFMTLINTSQMMMIKSAVASILV